MPGMTVVYIGEEVPETFERSLLILGPGATDDGYSWKVHECLPVLEKAGYDGVVMIFEPRPDESGKTTRMPLAGGYASLAREERTKAQMADVYLVWLPDAEVAPGYNTRHQIGRGLDSGKMVIGVPDNASKTDYVLHEAKSLQVPVASTLEEAVFKAIEMIGDGAERTAGERFVPPYVWHTAHFQQWYRHLKQARNRLDYAEVVWSWRIGPKRKITFFWILYPKVWITAENRWKDNEVVLARPDISVVVLYRRAAKLDDCDVVLIEEFRTPGSNPRGVVQENPGGSSWKEGVDPLVRAAEEVDEETGIPVDSSRFTYHGARQIAPTLSAHLAHLYSAPLTDEEMAQVDAQAGVAHGVIEDTERTYTVRTTVGAIRRARIMGWADLGMVLDVLAR